jgi:competence protein ComEC
MARALVFSFGILLGLACAAVEARAAEALLRVVDVGTGLCVIAVTPSGQTMVYDTGPNVRCATAVEEVVPARASRRADAPDDPDPPDDGRERRVIDLLVLSHSDADHIGGAVAILEQNQVLAVLHPGDDRDLGPASDRTTLGEVRDAIAASGAEDWSLAIGDDDLEFGREIDLGAASAFFVAGWQDGHDTEADDESALDGGELNNGLSIVIRYVYGGHSVLLTGDTVGRHANAHRDACDYAEARMVERAQLSVADGRVPIQSDVLVGQHHGGDNSSSRCFIREVRPTYVVFSAYFHPRASAADHECAERHAIRYPTREHAPHRLARRSGRHRMDLRRAGGLHR